MTGFSRFSRSIVIGIASLALGAFVACAAGGGGSEKGSSSAAKPAASAAAKAPKGVAPPVVLAATHRSALEVVSLEVLQAHAIDG